MNCKGRQKERHKMLTKEIGTKEIKIVASMMIEGQKDRRQQTEREIGTKERKIVASMMIEGVKIDK